MLCESWELGEGVEGEVCEEVLDWQRVLICSTMALVWAALGSESSIFCDTCNVKILGQPLCNGIPNYKQFRFVKND